MDASNILKPALATGELRCIGATTFQEYKQHFERDRALARRFQKIERRRAERRGDASRSCTGCKPQYEEHHGVTYTDDGAARPRPSSPPSTSTTASCPTRRSTSSTRPAPRRRSRPRASAQDHRHATTIEHVVAKHGAHPAAQRRRPPTASASRRSTAT